MVIVWGSRMVGKTDIVPGLFYVATRFGHIQWVPLLPRESYVLLSLPGYEGQGVPIPFSWKSIVLAWTRILLFIACVIATGGAAGASIDLNPAAMTLGLVAAALWFAFWFITWSKFNHASAARAYELAEYAGLNEHGLAQLAAIYGPPPHMVRV